MKKRIALALSMILLLSVLAGCGGGASSSSAPPAPSVESPAEPPAEPEEPLEDPDPDQQAAGTFEAEGRQYITADQIKADLEGGTPLFLLDIQPEEMFQASHLQGAVGTYAFPVDTPEEKAKIDAVLPDAAGKNLVIICPKGKGGANNTWDYLVESGYDMSTVFILENGQDGWPHPELLETVEEASSAD